MSIKSFNIERKDGILFNERRKRLMRFVNVYLADELVRRVHRQDGYAHIHDVDIILREELGDRKGGYKNRPGKGGKERFDRHTKGRPSGKGKEFGKKRNFDKNYRNNQMEDQTNDIKKEGE